MNSFTEDYFLRGKEKGLSNFEDYRWLPDTTISMVTHLKRYLGIQDGERVLDVGCATGNYVRALRMLGVDAYGYDVSEWAVNNAAPEVRPYVSNYLSGAGYDVVFSKDCCEHIPPDDLASLVRRLLASTRRKMFVIVPLAKFTGGEYVHPKEENDSTHVNRWTLHDWLIFFMRCTTSFVVNGSYLYPGLKPGAYEVECGYGFFTLTRI